MNGIQMVPPGSVAAQCRVTSFRAVTMWQMVLNLFAKYSDWFICRFAVPLSHSFSPASPP